MVSMGSFTPSSKACPRNVAIAYEFGVSRASIPRFDRRNRGVDADIKVGKVECRSVVGAIENGNVQLGSVFKVASIDRGG